MLGAVIVPPAQRLARQTFGLPRGRHCRFASTTVPAMAQSAIAQVNETFILRPI